MQPCVPELAHLLTLTGLGAECPRLSCRRRNRIRAMLGSVLEPEDICLALKCLMPLEVPAKHNTGDSNGCRYLIVGASPTGLRLANRLVRRDVRPMIIDGHAGPSREAKAANHSRFVARYARWQYGC